MVDATDLKSVAREGVWVRVPFPAPASGFLGSSSYPTRATLRPYPFQQHHRQGIALLVGEREVRPKTPLFYLAL